MNRPPFAQSYWVDPGVLCAGCHPGALDAAERDAKLHGLLDRGIRLVISLMEETETSYGGVPFAPYEPRLAELARERGVALERLSAPIRDAHIPTRRQMQRILAMLRAARDRQQPTYVHCWGGHGRTSTVVACYLIDQGCPADDAIAQVLHWRSTLPKRHYPFEGEQEAFVRAWVTP